MLDRGAPEGVEIVEGVPSFLNGLLARGEIDVAPCSSIEYARHADRYRIMPELVIGSRGAVRSILLLSRRPPAELEGCTVALPTASATSVVLLRILLRLRWGVRARFTAFDQTGDDPFATDDPSATEAHAALFIGDVALRPDLHPDVAVRLDLGREWWEWTGLPFAFAVWQVGGGEPAALRRLHTALLESRAYGRAHRAELAVRYAAGFGVPAAGLERYWSDLAFELDAPMIRGLREFYRLAAEIGELSGAPPLRWLE
jgi:chorismate dehydratase